MRTVAIKQTKTYGTFLNQCRLVNPKYSCVGGGSLLCAEACHHIWVCISTHGRLCCCSCFTCRDVESYIHRSGRTGRAGRAGVCIVCFTPAKEFMVTGFERKAKIKFTLISAPQRADIIRASARDAIQSFEKVPESTRELFRDQAEALIEKKGALDVVCSALAFISGNSAGVSDRSALSSMKGFTAFLLKTDNEVKSKGLLW